MIGLDVGTSVVKAVRFGEDWAVQATFGVPAQVDRPRHGWSEQDMTAVWQAVRDVLSRAVAGAGQVEAVCVTAQGDGCWLVGPDGAPVGPALLWNDARAGSVVDEWERDGLLDEAFRTNGSYGNAGLATSLLAWLERQRDPRLGRAATLLSCGSWVFACLTGRRVLHESDACNPFLDARSGQPALDLLERFGLGWAGRLLPPVVNGQDAVGTLLPDVAAALGLAPGTPVVLAPYDVPATAAGVGAVRPDDGLAILGTTLCVGRASNDPLLDRTPSGMTLRTGDPDAWLLAYATLAGTGVIEWARELLGLGSAADLVELAGRAAPDARLPLVLPYLSPAGERAPFRDPAASGAVLGLRFGHGPAEFARAVLEGLSLAVRDCLLAAGGTPTSLAVCGGGARSEQWCAMLADVCGVPVTSTGQEQAGALGAVLSGAAALGRTDALAVAGRAVSPTRAWQPRPEQAERYAALYEQWRAARP